jgi:hypothetical protein
VAPCNCRAGPGLVNIYLLFVARLLAGFICVFLLPGDWPASVCSRRLFQVFPNDWRRVVVVSQIDAHPFCVSTQTCLGRRRFATAWFSYIAFLNDTVHLSLRSPFASLAPGRTHHTRLFGRSTWLPKRLAPKHTPPPSALHKFTHPSAQSISSFLSSNPHHHTTHSPTFTATHTPSHPNSSNPPFLATTPQLESSSANRHFWLHPPTYDRTSTAY